ncbi:DHA2 family efflux MFS transporter permease subunit [Spirillospora sp. CA-294931]|uniref:DHA2 family efflux MFS transporter permease subunit n=1 Tax=Spirillospora sp. CA-294931 TaxID=3240042 RepID=UPI003D89E64E
MSTATSTPAPGAATGPGDGPNPMTIALVLVLGAIMVVLDQTVVNVAINRLSQDFDAPLSTLQWVVTGYSLALGAVIPSSAWATGRFGAKRLYMIAIGLFSAGSVLAGAAWNIESLIAFRVVQGLGGGLVLPLGMTILIRAASPDRLGRLMATLGLAVLIGPLIGPVVGGYLIDAVSWRWMFFINVPIGAAVLALASRVFPPDVPEPRRRLDVPGLLMLSPGLAALIYGVTTGGERGDFGDPGVLLPLLAGVALVVAFVGRGLTASDPLIDLRLFRDRTFTTATVTLVLFACGYFGSSILLPLYFQVVRGESATMSGLLFVPMALASGTAMQVAGRIIDKVPAGRLVPFAVALSFTGVTAFAVQLSAGASYWGLTAALVLMGAGGGMTMMPTMTTATRGLSREQGAAASTTVNLINTTVAAIGMAVASVLLTSAMASRSPAAADGLQGLHKITDQARSAAAPELADAFQHTYLYAIALMGLALIPTLFLPRRKAKKTTEG